MAKDLQGKVVIITGASSGIGRATALEMARQEARVVLAARRAAALQEVAQEIEALGGKALVIPTDVTQEDQNKKLVAETIAHWEQIDVFVANAGQYVRGRVTELSRVD